MAYFKNIKLSNFRNFKNLNLDFSKKCNVFYGSNGSGKTNLLEAISIFSKGRGLRKDKIFNFIKKNEEYFSNEANFVDEEIQVDFIEYPEEDFSDGGFVLWTDSEASFSEELSVEQSIENLREEEYRILESNWLTKTQKIKSPISSLQDGWIFIEHPYRNPKKEFTVIPNVIFMELKIGVNADFLKKNKSVWGGSIKPDALRSIIGSFCFSFCEKDEIMPRLPIVIKIKNGMATHWSSGYPQKDWLNR